MTILIPAYEPDERLLDLILQLHNFQLEPIVLVDDGSGPHYRGIFDMAEAFGCTVLTHEVNLGKGRALKTGFQYIQEASSAQPLRQLCNPDGLFLNYRY
ncbi:glycosyltransferase [Paenibacillus sp. FSL E2-0202]|uniref:glycosyltransferase n=1 Tax=Paenibacillus sp. FSL E2-0202 TaxID=2954505 RepID=UPI0030ECEDAF